MISIHMRYKEYFDNLLFKAYDLGVTVNTFNLRYRIRTSDNLAEKQTRKVQYPALRLSMFKEKRPNLLITVGLHGDEIAGPLTILDQLEEIVRLSQQYNVGFVIFPSINPSGFDLRLRYNITSRLMLDRDIPPNNDFMRYVKRHKVVDFLGEGDKCDTWVYSSDKNMVGRLPHETVRMHKQLQKLPMRKIKGHLDLHQDCFTVELFEQNPHMPYHNGRGTYVYVFETEPYIPIMQKAEQIVPAIRNGFVDTGYKQKPIISATGPKEIQIVPDTTIKLHSDANGFVQWRDCSITDLTDRLGVPYVAVVETTSKTPIEQAIAVNMVWIEGFMQLMQKKK